MRFYGVADRTEVNETAEKLTNNNKADFNLKLKSTLLFYKFYALIFAVDFRFSLCYTKLTEKAKKSEYLILFIIIRIIYPFHKNFPIVNFFC